MTNKQNQNPASMVWKAIKTDTVDAVRILAVCEDGRPYGPVVDVSTPDGEGTDTLVPLVTAAPRMLRVLLRTKALWDKHGLGDNQAESTEAYCDVCQAIANATGLPCTGIEGTFRPEDVMYSWPKASPKVRRATRGGGR